MESMCEGSEARECGSFKDKPVRRRNPHVWSPVERIPHEEAEVTVWILSGGQRRTTENFSDDIRFEFFKEHLDC